MISIEEGYFVEISKKFMEVSIKRAIFVDRPQRQTEKSTVSTHSMLTKGKELWID